MDEGTSVSVFGLPGFRLLDIAEVDGELEYVIVTAATLVGCTTCGSGANPKDRRDLVLGDLPHGEWPVRLRWGKRARGFFGSSCWGGSPDPDTDIGMHA